MAIPDFDTAWHTFTDGRPRRGISSELLPLLRELYDQIARRPADLAALKDSIHRLLTFLASGDGRTEENCCTTDSFLCLSDDVEWDHLPRDFAYILADMAGALHDTVSSPETAANFDSTPEQLLTRLSAVQVE